MTTKPGLGKEDILIILKALWYFGHFSGFVVFLLILAILGAFWSFLEVSRVSRSFYKLRGVFGHLRDFKEFWSF